MDYLTLAYPLLALACHLAAPPKPRLWQPDYSDVGRVLAANRWGVAYYSGAGELRVLPVSAAMGRGELLPYANSTSHYPAVRPGDLVRFSIEEWAAGQPVCVGVRINARPGGRVPARPDEGDSRGAWHVMQNRKNDAQKAIRDARVAERLAGTYVPPPRKKKPAAVAKP